MKSVFSIIFLLTILLSASCAKNENFNSTNPENKKDIVENPDANPETPVVPPSDGSGQTPTAPDYSKMEALAWESVSTRRSWSETIYKVIETEEKQMLAEAPAADVAEFCPRFRYLSKQQRLNFWGQLFVAMSYYESGWKPTSRYWEQSMGIDPVTGQNVYSEGLLQMSYQDVQAYKFCEFDWSKDKNLSATDPKKTIFDPAKNLRCGVKVLARQLTKQNYIGSSKGVYWAVLYRSNARNKIAEISAMTKSLSFCE